MADEDDSQKTEEPTQRRLDKAFEEGSVAKSSEVTSWFMLAATTLVIAFSAGPLLKSLQGSLLQFVERPQTISLDGRSSEALAVSLSLVFLKAVAVPFAVLMVAGLAGHFVVHRPTWSMKPLSPDLEKLSPLKGFERIFGMQGLTNFLKALLKFVLIGSASAAVLWPARGVLLTFVDKAPETILPGARALSIQVLEAILAVLAVLAIGDLLYQRLEHRRHLRMTKQEVRDEYKELEGDPKIKARIRQIRMERSRRRMMQAIPKATVVVANPTHFAVALRYVEKETSAPVCVAKGVDELALRIRFAAKQHKVPIVDNPPLARALYATVEIDEMVPKEHYRAVAEVIGYVLRLKSRGRQAGRRGRRAPAARRIT